MAKVKISEFSSTPGNNTDIDGINLAEGCAPSGINDAIRELMAQLKDWQSGTSNDPYVVGSSGSLTLSYGTANGVAYLNGSKVLTTGSALTFDGTNLGIGITSPSYKLQVVSGSTAPAARFQYTGTASFQPTVTLRNTADGNGYISQLDLLGQNAAGTDQISFIASQTNTSGYEPNLLFGMRVGGSTYTERMRIDSSGNVGIGTSSPSVKLQVQGSAGSNPEIRCLDGTVNSQWYAGSDGTCVFGTYSNHPIVWRTNGSERARIDSSGNLLINTTTLYPGDGNTSTGCMVQAGSTGGKVFASASAGNEAGAFNRNDNGTLIKILRSGSIVGSIGVSATNTSFNTSSDYRLKEAIAPMTDALAKVALLKPCTYKWKVDGSDGQGFIAHELAEVEPGCVTGEKDAVDADGNPKYQGIDTSFLVATLTAAIQELKAIVDAQGAEIAALKGQA